MAIARNSDSDEVWRVSNNSVILGGNVINTGQTNVIRTAVTCIMLFLLFNTESQSRDIDVAFAREIRQ
jgi:hypothetical protein